MKNKTLKIEKVDHIDCDRCHKSADCCRFGAWIDLEEAKKIILAGIKGDFFHLEQDHEFPSGFKVGTSIEDEQCVFQDPDGLCRVHKVDYALKPVTCKEFPYENGKIAPIADVLCVMHRAKLQKDKKGKKK